MSARQTLAVLAMLGLLISCSGENGEDAPGDGGNVPPPEGIAPSAATLIFPENNTECTEGTVVNDLESSINFQWNVSQNTDFYEVHVRYLESNAVAITESQTNTANITLERGVGYEWFVVSKNNTGTATANSAKWRFYNQGAGELNYPPFPAEAIFPTRGRTIDGAGTLRLEWSATDLDNDIASYEIFFGTTADPEISLGTTQQTSAPVNVAVGEVYYWSVKTTDAAGNSSRSEVFDFTVR